MSKAVGKLLPGSTSSSRSTGSGVGNGIGISSAARSTADGGDHDSVFSESSEIATHKVVTVGDCGVGKTSLILRITQQPDQTTRSTLGTDFFTWLVTVDNGRKKKDQVNLQIWDTAGEEKFKDTLSNAYFRNTRAALFVFSMDDENTLMFLDKWIEDALVYSPKDVKLFLCGNKSDKAGENADTLQSQADFLAERYNIRRVFYTSALTGDGIFELEQGLAREVLGMDPLIRDGDVIDLAEQEDDELENPSNCVC
ncbi:ras-related protein Rab-13-like [Sycon ciliatum]|uniref:ras-related protein Rab-13-like n=1 Tax=Sycon ciliatum TaxID=27933 RepID=UPI0020AA6A88|eukprot:scpid91977/ scgid25952/ GTP-binding protein ryh1